MCIYCLWLLSVFMAFLHRWEAYVWISTLGPPIGGQCGYFRHFDRPYRSFVRSVRFLAPRMPTTKTITCTTAATYTTHLMLVAAWPVCSTLFFDRGHRLFLLLTVSKKISIALKQAFAAQRTHYNNQWTHSIQQQYAILRLG